MPMWLMACQTLGPRDLKLGMYIPLDPGSDLVNIPTQGGGGGGGTHDSNLFATRTVIL